MSARNPTYPGVYILELPSGVRTITGVSTSMTAFIGRALKGPIYDPIIISSFAAYEQIFGGLWRESNMSYAVYQYFQNGGRDAVILRVHNAATESTIDVDGKFTLRAANPGGWSKNLKVEIKHETEADIQEIVDAEKAIDPAGTNTLFNLIVNEAVSSTETNTLELFRNLSNKPNSQRFITRILEEESDLVRAESVISPPERPGEGMYSVGTAGTDGNPLSDSDITGSAGPPKKTGIHALDNTDLFNLLCIPPYNPTSNTTAAAVYSEALGYCEKRRAMLIVDPPSGWNSASAPLDSTAGIDGANLRPLRHKNAAIFFPRIKAADPQDENKVRDFVPCGVIAGVIARIDSERGLWKSPAGIETTLIGVFDLTVKLTDDENGRLNPLGVNCLRILPPAGIVVWGARTLRGADRLADQWKYLAVRRMALYIEESLYRGTQWVVFEPNDEKLWAQIRLNVGAFMHDLFTKGAFQGTDPKKAYFVKCDTETTTQFDIDRGIVNIIVGFAPLKPAEFVILQIQQIAGQESE